MQLFFIKKTRINKYNTVAHIPERDESIRIPNFRRVEDYIKRETEKLPDQIDRYEFGWQEKINDYPEINGTNLTRTTFKATFTSEFINLDKPNEYSAVIIFKYPLLDYMPKSYQGHERNYSYWKIIKKEFKNNEQWTFTFKIDLFTTYGFSKINFSPVFTDTQRIRTSRMHIDYHTKNNSEKTLDFLRENQATTKFEYVQKLAKNQFINEKEEAFKKAKIDFWAVLSINTEMFKKNNSWIGKDKNGREIDFNPVITVDNLGGGGVLNFKGSTFLLDEATVLIPITGDRAYNVVFDGREDTDDPLLVSFFDQLHNILDEEFIIDARIIDFFPFDDGVYMENGDTDTIYVELDKFFILKKDDRIFGFSPVSINPANTKKTFTVKKDNEFKTYDDKRKNIKPEDFTDYNMNQILELEFAPFKLFEHRIGLEAPFSSRVFSNGELKTPMHSGWINLYFNFSPYNWVLTKECDFIYGSKEIVFPRSIQLPTRNDAWKEYNQQRLNRSLSDYGKPAKNTVIGAAAGAAAGSVGGPIGAIGGAVIGSIAGLIGIGTTQLKRDTIKNTPDTLSNVTTDLNNILIHSKSRLNDVFIHTPSPWQQEKIAFEFFRFGTATFDMLIDLNEVFSLPKYRFNYIQISQNQDISIIREGDEEIANLYLQELKEGKTFWEPLGLRGTPSPSQDRLFRNMFFYRMENQDKSNVSDWYNATMDDVDKELEAEEAEEQINKKLKTRVKKRIWRILNKN